MFKQEEFIGHEQDDEYCPLCWGWGPQKKCECGGVIHSQFYEESHDDVILIYECDQCNSEYNLN